GRGIHLFKNVDDKHVDLSEPQVVQQYIAKPYLINGLKFDLRIYVLVASVDPLTIYLYKDGMARFCTVPYSEPTNRNINMQFMHLTNYAINKNNDDFVFNEGEDAEDSGSKWGMDAINDHLEKEGHDVPAIWKRINDIFVKTLFAVLPSLRHIFHTCRPSDVHGVSCFEVLGFDILLDHKMKPWLIEVNHSPSFRCDTPLDHRLKHGVITGALKLLNIQQGDRFK
ncbi:tubulin-tyrosine ligase/Tubulin polyglutamylase, partial [Kipferlia bialata]